MWQQLARAASDEDESRVGLMQHQACDTIRRARGWGVRARIEVCSCGGRCLHRFLAYFLQYKHEVLELELNVCHTPHADTCSVIFAMVRAAHGVKSWNSAPKPRRQYGSRQHAEPRSRATEPALDTTAILSSPFTPQRPRCPPLQSAQGASSLAAPCLS